jgi:Fe2+ or Zn2+ uptake regulation protein
METQTIDQRWRDLSLERRDILVALARDGPASGADVHRRLRGQEPQTEPSTHRNLQVLLDAGLVDREPVDNRENRYSITDDGVELVRVGVLEPAAHINVEQVEE